MVDNNNWDFIIIIKEFWKDLWFVKKNTYTNDNGYEHYLYIGLNMAFCKSKLDSLFLYSLCLYWRRIYDQYETNLLNCKIHTLSSNRFNRMQTFGFVELPSHSMSTGRSISSIWVSNKSERFLEGLRGALKTLNFLYP